MLPSLYGHLVFGPMLGFAYSRGDRCIPVRLFRRSGETQDASVRRVA